MPTPPCGPPPRGTTPWSTPRTTTPPSPGPWRMPPGRSVGTQIPAARGSPIAKENRGCGTWCSHCPLCHSASPQPGATVLQWENRRVTQLPSAILHPQGAQTKDFPEAPAGCPGLGSSFPANAATEPAHHAWSAERMLGTPTLAAHENHVGSVPELGCAGPVRVNVCPSFSGGPESTSHLGIRGLDGG